MKLNNNNKKRPIVLVFLLSYQQEMSLEVPRTLDHLLPIDFLFLHKIKQNKYIS